MTGQSLLVCRQERQKFWEQEKVEAKAYKERRERLHSRMHRAHTARMAKALSAQWPAQTSITRQDVAVACVFAAGCAGMCVLWLSQPGLGRPESSQAVDVGALSRGAVADPEVGRHGGLAATTSAGVAPPSVGGEDTSTTQVPGTGEEGYRDAGNERLRALESALRATDVDQASAGPKAG